MSFLVRLAVLFFCAATVALAQVPPRAEPVLGVGDVVKITVYQTPDLAVEARVSELGQINFPPVGVVTIGGLSVSQAQALIEKRLRDGGFVLKPQVTIQTTQIRSSQVSILGQVAKPGQVGYYPNMTIVDAIASAGGFTGIAAKNSVNLRREVGGKIETHIYPVADITEGRSQNVNVLPGDVLVVDERVF